MLLDSPITSDNAPASPVPKSATDDGKESVGSFLVKETLKEVISETDLQNLAKSTLVDSAQDSEVIQDICDSGGMVSEHSYGSTTVDSDPVVQKSENTKKDSHKTSVSESKCQTGKMLGPRPTAVSLGLTKSVEECMRTVSKDKLKEDTGTYTMHTSISVLKRCSGNLVTCAILRY